MIEDNEGNKLTEALADVAQAIRDHAEETGATDEENVASALREMIGGPKNVGVSIFVEDDRGIASGLRDIAEALNRVAEALNNG